MANSKRPSFHISGISPLSNLEPAELVDRSVQASHQQLVYLKMLVEIHRCLDSEKTSPLNQFHQVAFQWIDKFGSEEVARQNLQRRIALQAYQRGLPESAINELATVDVFNPPESLLLRFLDFFSLFNSEVAKVLLDNEGLLAELNEQQLFEIAQSSEVFALGLLVHHVGRLMRMSEDQLFGISRSHEWFAFELFVRSGLLVSRNLLLYKTAKFNEYFALVLLDCHPRLLAKLNMEQLCEIAQSHELFALALLDEPELLKGLTPLQLLAIAQSCEQFALGLLDHSEFLNKVKIYDLYRIAQSCELFALGLLDQVDQVDRLSKAYLQDIARSHESFALLLLDYPELLSKLKVYDLCLIAEDHESFALALLSRPKILKKVYPDDLRKIVQAHPALAVYPFFCKFN